MKIIYSTILLLASAGLYATAHAQTPPQIQNLRAAQRPGNFLVDINFDIVDPDSLAVWVMPEISSDGGATYSVPAQTLSGDVGGITPGTGKRIVWNALFDWPGNLTTNARVRLSVTDVKVVAFDPPQPTPTTNLVWIPAGSFMMGSPPTEAGRVPDEGPGTWVTISQGFWMSQFEVTQGEYLALMGSNPSTFPGDARRPVENVSWADATNYCAKLTQQERSAGRLPAGYVYRLPTEAEWEYTCRAGSMTRFSYGDDPDGSQAGKRAWFTGNSSGQTHRVGQLLPNRWGLYDMHGNVVEWCSDWYGPSYPGGDLTDPKGATSGSSRVFRGGSWYYSAVYLRCSYRCYGGMGYGISGVGFRCVLGQP